MLTLGWGTPTLITLTLGVLLEVPDPIRIVILGLDRRRPAHRGRGAHRSCTSKCSASSISARRPSRSMAPCYDSYAADLFAGGRPGVPPLLGLQSQLRLLARRLQSALQHRRTERPGQHAAHVGQHRRWRQPAHQFQQLLCHHVELRCSSAPMCRPTPPRAASAFRAISASTFLSSFRPSLSSSISGRLSMSLTMAPRSLD